MKTTFLSSALALALLAGAACRPQATAEHDPSPKVEGDTVSMTLDSPALSSVKVEAAQPAAAPRTRLNGRLVWNDDCTVRVYAPFAGRVDRVIAQAAQTVVAGDTLALIASAEYAVSQADAGKAEADFALAGRTVERLRILAEHGAAAQKDLLTAEADFARARWEKERANAIVRMRGGPAADGGPAFALKSPIGGVVVERNLSPGQEVRSDQMLANAPQFFAPLFVVSDPGKLWVMVDASDRDLAALRPGTPLTVRSPAFPERTFPGEVEWISDSLDPATRMVRVRGRIENPERRLKAEMFVAVEFESAGLPGVDVPATAVFTKGEKSFVYVEEQPARYVRREVEAGAQRDGKIALRHGLRAGERVVTSGSLLLDEIRANAGGTE